MRLSAIALLIIFSFNVSAAAPESQKSSGSWFDTFFGIFPEKKSEKPKKVEEKPKTVAERNKAELKKKASQKSAQAKTIKSKSKSKAWVTYYTDKAKVDDFDPFELLVLDSMVHPPIIPLKQKGKMLLGYISLGEVEKHRPYFKDVQAQGILGEMNPNWPGSYYVDIRDPRWFKRVVEELVPAIINKGFDGIFMDTLDNAEYLEEKDPRTYKGMKQAAIKLVKGIRQHYPNIKIMMNRAFKILPALVHTIDMEMGESVYAHYDFKGRKYQLQSADEHKYYVSMMKGAQRRNPKLLIYTLDYWYKNQKDVIKNIYKKQRAYGFHPYVATIKLNEIIPEPGRQHAKVSG